MSDDLNYSRRDRVRTRFREDDRSLTVAAPQPPSNQCDHSGAATVRERSSSATNRISRKRVGTRRDLLRHIGAAISLAAAGEEVLTAQDAQHVHSAIAQDSAAHKGKYQPKALTAHEYATLERLAAWIVPADEHSKGALEAGAADFIDFLCAASDEMRDIYTGGLAWLDDESRRRNDGKDFLTSQAAQQTALLDLIAFRKNESPELNPGIQFFAWARRMVVDAYYTSPIGIKDLGYMGNSAMSQFSVPQEALEYALKRSPFA